MIAISSEVAFWILDAYCRIGSQLHFRGVFKGEKFEWGAVVESTTMIGAKISLKLFDWSDGQKGEWIDSVSLVDVKEFRFDPSGKVDSRSNSTLEIEFKDGSVIVFSEPLPAKSRP